MSADRPSNAPEACVGPASDEAGKASACAGCPNQSACAAGEGKKVDPAVAEVQARLADVKHKILVLSGKGGVGKSTFSSQLSWTLASQGYQVGILDIDICGPSVPRMLGVELQEVRKSNFGWSPVYASENLGVMSVAFMLGDRNDAIIWRGPRKNGLIKQFLTDVEWGALDFLIVDAPPGTSDEHISIAQYLTKAQVDGAVIVTTPQEMALLDVRKEITFCHKVGVPVLGVVENMAGFVCPGCHLSSDIFPAATGSGGALKMAAEMKASFLGSIPLDPNLLQACENGVCFVETYPNSAAVQPFMKVVQKLLTSTPSLTETSAAHMADSTALAATAAAAASSTSVAATPAAASASSSSSPYSLALVCYADQKPSGIALLLAVDDTEVLSEQLDMSADMGIGAALLEHESNAGGCFFSLHKRTFSVQGRSCTFHAVPAAIAKAFDPARMQRNPVTAGAVNIHLRKAIMSTLALKEIRAVNMDTA